MQPRLPARAVAAVADLVAVDPAVDPAVADLVAVDPAVAVCGGGSGGGHSDGGSGGGHSDGGSGGGHSDGGSAGGSGQGGPSADSEGKGPKSKAGKPADGKKGKPAWAQEGIPEVELGRLNVARSPDKVLDRQLAEAVSTIEALPDAEEAALVGLYDGTVEEFTAAVTPETWDSLTIIDSPVQNLALLRDIYDGDDFALSDLGIAPSDDLAAMVIGVASDKTIPITEDTVKALNVIMDLKLTPEQIKQIAIDAEAVRQAVATAHG